MGGERSVCGEKEMLRDENAERCPARKTEREGG